MDALSKTIHVLGIAGSLRKASYNRAVLRAMQELAPEGMTIEIFDLLPIPMFNEDVEREGMPEPVARLRESIADADALLIVTPEYNKSIPAPLKNALDWASRSPNSPLNGKPVAITGASPGIMGTAWSQHHVRQVCVNVNLLPVNKPEVFISRAHEKFDSEGRLTDEMTRKLLAELLASLADWTRRLRGEQAQ
jgi:chromate reductase